MVYTHTDTHKAAGTCVEKTQHAVTSRSGRATHTQRHKAVSTVGGCQHLLSRGNMKVSPPSVRHTQTPSKIAELTSPSFYSPKCVGPEEVPTVWFY